MRIITFGQNRPKAKDLRFFLSYQWPLYFARYQNNLALINLKNEG